MSTINRKLLRHISLDYRRTLSPEEYKKRNHWLCQQLLAFLDVNTNIKVIHVFLAISKNREPDISAILPELWSRDIKTMTSRTIFSEKQMEHYWLDDKTEITISSKGIPEPSKDSQKANPNEADLILVPALLIDKLGNRLGYGGGFYDRFLATNHQIKTLALSLGPCVDQLPSEKWDIPVDQPLYFDGSA